MTISVRNFRLSLPKFARFAAACENSDLTSMLVINSSILGSKNSNDAGKFR